MSKEIWFEVHAPPICSTSEESSFDLFTLTDHLMKMRKPNGSENHPLECWTTLAGLVDVMNEIKLVYFSERGAYSCPT